MVKVRAANARVPVSQPFWKKTIPVSFVWPAAAPGDIKEGYQPSNWLPLVPPSPQLGMNGNCEFAINCGAVQSLKVEAGSRRVIPPSDSIGLADERQQVEPEIVIEADLRLLLQNMCPAPAAGRNSGIRSADAWLAE